MGLKLERRDPLFASPVSLVNGHGVARLDDSHGRSQETKP